MIIYKITNKINNKVYIGLTTQTVETRWKQHIQTAFSENHPDSQTIFKKAIRKYGPDNFKIEVIDEANNLEDLKKLEQYWIKYYNSYIGWDNCQGYNSTYGGDAPTKISRPVCKVNILTGLVEETYPTIKAAEEKYSRGISEIAHNRIIGQKPKGYTWVFEDELSQYTVKDYCIKYKVICQLDRMGELVNLWLDREAAAQSASTSVANIWSCLNEDRLTAGSYQWCKYEDLGKRIHRMVIEKSNNKPVAQYDLCDNLIQVWPSMSAAAKATGTPLSKISRVCNGKQKTSNGFKWKFDI